MRKMGDIHIGKRWFEARELYGGDTPAAGRPPLELPETGRNVSRKRWKGHNKKDRMYSYKYVNRFRVNDRALQNPLVARSSFRVITSCLGEFQSPAGSLASARARRPHTIPLFEALQKKHTDNSIHLEE